MFADDVSVILIASNSTECKVKVKHTVNTPTQYWLVDINLN